MILAMRTRKATRQTEDADMFQEVQLEHEVTCIIVLPVQVAGWAALNIRWHDPLEKNCLPILATKTRVLLSQRLQSRYYPYV